MSSVRVLVVGGGIGGLALAVGLRDRGADVEVFERAKTFGNTGSGVELTPNGVKSLTCICAGLGSAAVRSGWPSTRHVAPIPVLRADGKLLRSRDLAGFPEKWGAPLVGILRSELHRLLTEAADRPGAGKLTVHHDATVTSVASTARHASLELADGRTAEGDVVIGADGVRSTVRGIVVPGSGARYMFASIRGIAPRTAEHTDGFVVVGPAGHFFAEAVDAQRAFWTATVKAPEGSWPARSAETAKGDLLDLWGDWAQPMPTMVAATDLSDIVVTDVHDCSPLPRWHSGRVALLGDAAHPIGPVLGQGANMALEDAAFLSKALAERDVPAALRWYERTRSRRANRIIRHTRVVALLGHTTNPAAARLRDVVIRMRRRDETYRDKELYSYRP
jgi:salicylate hydroxylase